MTRRQLLGGTVAVGGIAVAGAAGFGLWGSRGEAAWTEATAAIRRPFDRGGGVSELVRAATLAANSHNTQPWLFRSSGTVLAIAPDLSRRTPIVDPDDHHLYVSLGCAAENVIQAAPDLGLAASIAVDAVRDGIALDVTSASSAASGPLGPAILHRQCTRSTYDGRAVPAGDIAALARTARGDGVDALFITDRPAVDDILALAVEANTAQVTDPAFTAELKQWLRFSYANALATDDGLFSKCSGNPVLPGPIGPLMFGFVYTADAENARLVEQVRSSSGIAVFVSEADDRRHWIEAGRAYQRFALQATALGIRHAFINQPVEVAAVRRRLSDHLGLGSRRPNLVVRFGYTPEMPMSMRRPVEAVMVS